MSDLIVTQEPRRVLEITAKSARVSQAANRVLMTGGQNPRLTQLVMRTLIARIDGAPLETQAARRVLQQTPVTGLTSNPAALLPAM